MFETLRSGAFLTRERVTLWAAALILAYALTIAFLFATAHGLNDYQGRPLGTDFSSFYAAGRLALDGRSPYDQAGLFQMQRGLFGSDTAYYAFAYPPIFLLIATALAKLPYLVALAFWQVGTLALYLAAMTRLKRRYGGVVVDDRLFFVLALGFTATFVNLTHGQNGFLSAALLALGLSFVDENDWAAGVCFGLLAFKPQLGLLIPFALVAGGRWRSVLAASGTVIVLIGLSALAFGVDAWRGFLAASAFAQHAILDHGAVGYQKMVSVFAWMRLWHAPLALAYAMQAAAALIVLGVLLRLWRSTADPRIKGAALCSGVLLVTPFAFDYDMTVLAPAILLVASHAIEDGAQAYERMIAVALWLVPIAARATAEYVRLPLGVLIMLIAFGLIVRTGLSKPASRPVLSVA